MNEDPRPDDELVSAVLDGEATLEERALVEGSAEGRRRLESLRSVAAQVGHPVPPLSDATITRLVDRAVAEAQPAPSSGRSGRRWRTWVAAAAAAVVLLGAVAALVRGVGPAGRSDDTASSASPTVADREASGGSIAAPAAEATPTPEPVLPRVADLGPQPDATTALDQALVLTGARSGANASASSSPAPSASSAESPLGADEAGAGSVAADQKACPPPDEALGDAAGWDAVATAELPTGPIVVWRGPDPTGAARLVAVDLTTCAVLAHRTG